MSRPSSAVPTPAPVRSAFLDNAKAQLIALVVFTHLFELVLRYEQPAQSFYQLILLFHMPAFVFVTGYLSRPDAFSPRAGILSRCWCGRSSWSTRSITSGRW